MDDNFPIFLDWSAFMCKITFISQLVKAHTTQNQLHKTAKFATLYISGTKVTEPQIAQRLTNYE